MENPWGFTLGKGSANAGFSTSFSTRLRRRVSHGLPTFDGVLCWKPLEKPFFLWWTAGYHGTHKLRGIPCDTCGILLEFCGFIIFYPNFYHVLSCFIMFYPIFGAQNHGDSYTKILPSPDKKTRIRPVQWAQVASYVVTSGIIALQSRIDQAPVCE